MRLSKKAEYALRALVALAREKKSWSIQDLSSRENIPVKFLEQILLSLRHAGMLNSKRGVGGGYVLLKAPSEITIGDVLRCLDGPIAPIPCASEQVGARCSCPDPRTCVVRLAMTEVRSELAQVLDKRTIEDMLALSPSPGLAFDI